MIRLAFVLVLLAAPAIAEPLPVSPGGTCAEWKLT